MRYSKAAFRRVLLLGDGDLVRPQNYFSSLSWHARRDTARSLLNRALGSDYPGTLGCAGQCCCAPAGYSVRHLKRMLPVVRQASAGGTECGAIRLQAVASAETEARRTASQR